MKKQCTLGKKLFALVVLSSMLIGCSTPTDTNQSAGAGGKESSQTENTMFVETTNEGTEPSENTSVETTLVPETTLSAEIQFEEIVVVDNEVCTIKVTGIEPDDFWGYAVNVYLENKSADKTYMFSTESAALNGIDSDPIWAEEVAPGKKANETINWYDTTLTECGIADVTDIEISFRVYDSNDWMADAVAEETVHIYPYGEDRAEKYVRTLQDTDVVLVNNDQVTVAVIGYEIDSIWGYTVKLYLENKTAATTMFTVDEAAVNGYMADPFWSRSVIGGKCAFSTMSWSTSTLEESGITNVEEISFMLRAYNAEDYSANDYVNEAVTLNP